MKYTLCMQLQHMSCIIVCLHQHLQNYAKLVYFNHVSHAYQSTIRSHSFLLIISNSSPPMISYFMKYNTKAIAYIYCANYEHIILQPHLTCLMYKYTMQCTYWQVTHSKKMFCYFNNFIIKLAACQNNKIFCYYNKKIC